MVNKFQAAVGTKTGIKREFRIGWSASYQRSTGIVCDPSYNRSTEVGGSGDRVRFTAMGPQGILELKECRARQTYGLTAASYQVHTFDPQGIEDDDFVVGNADLEAPPEFGERAWPKNNLSIRSSEPECWGDGVFCSDFVITYLAPIMPASSFTNASNVQPSCRIPVKHRLYTSDL